MLDLTRVVPWARISHPLRQTEDAVMAAVSQIMRVPPDDRAALQAVLPSRLGGLGIMRTALDITNTA